jgi:hypothetical protein
MSTKKPAIPATSSLPPDVARVVAPIKETLEIMTGARGGQMKQLSNSASTAEIIAAINAIIARLNASGS